MKFKNHIVITAVLFLFIVSCKKDPITISQDDSANYFPLQTNRYIIYSLDSIHYNDVTMTSDTTRFQIKEQVGSSFSDSTGAVVFIIIRSKRISDTTNWIETDHWSATVTTKRAEKTEENLRFVKLIFPVGEGLSWNGNQYIDNANGLINYYDWEYMYSDVHESKLFNNLSFDSTVTVTEQDNENLIEKDFEQEVYAKNVGLVYRMQEHVSKQNVNTPWLYPEKGTKIIMTVKEFN